MRIWRDEPTQDGPVRLMLGVAALALQFALGWPIAHRRGVRAGREEAIRDMQENHHATWTERQRAWQAGRSAAMLCRVEPEHVPFRATDRPSPERERHIQDGVRAKERAIMDLPVPHRNDEAAFWQ